MSIFDLSANAGYIIRNPTPFPSQVVSRPRRGRLTQDEIEYIEGLPDTAELYKAWVGSDDRVNVNVLSPADFGAAANGTDDSAALQALINSIQNFNVDFTDYLTAATVRYLPRYVIDLGGKTYTVKSQLHIDNVYNVTLYNGVIKGDYDTAWGDTFMVKMGTESATDMARNQPTRNVTLRNVTLDGGGKANCLYLVNTWSATVDSCIIMGWYYTGNYYGIDTADSTLTPSTNNTNLRILNTTVSQKDSAEIVATWVATGGTGIRLRSSDFIIDGLIAYGCDLALDIDKVYNCQISNTHLYVKDTQLCMRVGASANHVAVHNLYSDTGIVEIRSFSHTFTGCQFVANSTVNLIATIAGETAAGLKMDGKFSKQPTFTTEGAGTWATYILGSISGCLHDGTPINGRGRDIRGAGKNASIGCYYSTHPALQLHGTAAGDAMLGITRWSSTAAAGPVLWLGHGYSDTVNTMTALPSGAVLGKVAYGGSTGATLNPAGATVGAVTTGAWTATSAPAKLVFATTPNASAAPSDAWEMRQNKHLVPVGSRVVDIGESANPVRTVYASTVTLPGPYADDAAAAASGYVAVGDLYRKTGGTVVWRQA